MHASLTIYSWFRNQEEACGVLEMGIPVSWVLEYVLEGGWAKPSGGFIPLALRVLAPWREAGFREGPE